MTTQPDMHRCLKVPELFSTICHFSSHQDLYKLARTCREFTSSALDDLWFELDEGIVPLLYCFPDGVIGRRKRGSGFWDWNYGYWEGSEWRDTGFHIQRLPLAHEWDRVMFHASRVRSLRMCDEDMSDKRGERCYQLFLDHWPHGSRPVFPNLRSVHYKAPCDIISKFAAFAATSCPLQTISCTAVTPHLPHDFENFDMRTLATCMQISRNSIKSLSIDCSYCLLGPHGRPRRSFNGIFDNTCEALLGLKNLRTASFCNPLSSAVIAHLARLPDLHTLTFAVVGTYHDPQLLAPHPDNFRSLRQVHIKIMTFPLQNVCAFFDNISGILLQEARIEFNDIGGGPLAGELIALIHSISRYRSLHKIEISSKDRLGDANFRPRDPVNWPIQCSTVVRSFSRIPDLCVLSIISLPLHTSVEDIGFIASTWPGMQVLSLGGAPDTVATSSVHVTDLQPLVTRCPRLTTLSVTLLRRSPDAEDVLPVGVHECVQRVSVVLRDPAVGPGHYHYPEKDCEALGLMFPNSRDTHFEVEFINKSCAPHFVDSDPDEYEYEEEEDPDE